MREEPTSSCLLHAVNSPRRTTTQKPERAANCFHTVEAMSKRCQHEVMHVTSQNSTSNAAFDHPP